MKSTLTINLAQAVASLFFSIILILPVKRVTAQQRSAYDLAAWIIAAVDTYDTANVNWALKQGGQIDYKRAGMNALELAIYYKKTAMVKFLLEKGASVDSVSQDGLNALQYAEKRGEPEIIQLIKKKMKPDAVQAVDLVKNNTLAVKKDQVPANVIGVAIQAKAYKVGDKVLHSRDRGKTWEIGTIKEISTNARLIADGVPAYLVENSSKTDQKYLDLNFITTLTRQPSWTSFFLDDWDLNLPMAATERVIDRDVYTIFSGGDRLPPLRIKSDGSYTWVIDKNKVIKGRWKENDNGPGIILLQGYRATNWLVYNTTDANNRKIYKRDYIIVTDVKGNYTANHGFRIGKGNK
ncbi:MAG: hypothetical protein JWR18_1124 [Segetibacter sp.]|nr:hypothetical protein [Segetibacter sp.]